MRPQHLHEKGMTLVEVLVALPIAALIAAGTAGVFYQIAVTRVEVNDSLAANEELQRAGAWFSLDAVQAQTVSDENFDDAGTVQIAVDQVPGIAGTEEFLVEWTNWDNDIVEVLYSLVTVPGSSLKELHRTVRTNGSVTTSHVAAERLDDSVDPGTSLNRTRFEWSSDDKETVRFVVTARSGETSVTRTYEVRPRSAG